MIMLQVTEIDQTLSRLSAYKNVRGVLVLTRPGAILRQSGPAFDGDRGKVYAKVVLNMVDAIAKGIEEADEGVCFH